jgi:putative membrane protein
MHPLIHLGVLALTVFLLARLVPSVRVRSFGSAVLVAVVFSVLNFFLYGLLKLFIGALIFIPAILTLGLLFGLLPFLVNAVLLWLTDKMMASFEIRTLRGLLFSAGVITLVNWAFNGRAFQAVMNHHAYTGGTWV